MQMFKKLRDDMEIKIPKFRIVDSSDGERGVCNQRQNFDWIVALFLTLGVPSTVLCVFCCTINTTPKPKYISK